MVFNFRKIKETIAAFKAKRPKPPEDRLDSGKDQYTIKIMQHPPSNKAVNLVVLLIVLLRCVWIFNYILHSFTQSCNLVTTTGLGAIVLTLAYDRLRKKLFAAIPFYKLNPYFGDKLEETINAFRKSRST